MQSTLLKKAFRSHGHQGLRLLSFDKIQDLSLQKVDEVTVKNLRATEHIKQDLFPKLVSGNLRCRIAKQIVSLESLPFALTGTNSFKKVLLKNIDALQTLCDTNPDNTEFDAFLKGYLNRDATTFSEIAIGLHEWRMDMESKYPNNNFAIFSKQIDESLGEFFFKRLSARLIITNYLNVKDRGLSIIEDNVQVDTIIQKAFDEAKFLCVKKYGISPGLKTEGSYPNFKYIPSHFFSIIFELLKNSMEATILNHQKSEQLPEVEVQMNDAENNLVIRIHDHGAGVPPQDLNFIWSHFYSTSSDSVHNSIEDPTRMLDSAVLSGFGFGLPITKMLIQFFGGEMALNSVYGSSTDVHLYFQGNDDAKYNTINMHHSY